MKWSTCHWIARAVFAIDSSRATSAPDNHAVLELPGLAVTLGELLLDAVVFDDDEFPVLPVVTGRCAQRQLDALQHHRVIDRVRKHPSHRSLSHHRVKQRHVQTGQRLGCGRHTRTHRPAESGGVVRRVRHVR